MAGMGVRPNDVEGSDVRQRSGHGQSAAPLQQSRMLGSLQDLRLVLKLDRRAHMIAETVLTKDNGIASRTLAVASLSEVFHIDPDTLHGRFLANAPALGAAAGKSALQEAGLAAGEIDGLVISTCTGYLCPGLTSYVVERLGLRADVLAFDLVGQGCAAALPNWRLADALLAAGSCRHVLSICVEVSSAAMYLDNDPGVLISACLFGDGAGAAVLSRHPNPQRRSIEWKSFASLVNPAERDALLFETRSGMLRNILTRPVPRLAADHAEQVLHTVLGTRRPGARGHQRLDHACGRARRADRAAGPAATHGAKTCVTAQTCCAGTAT